jgi:hypothetical protein
LFAGRFRLEPALPLAARSLELMSPTVPVLRQRRDALLGARNFWEAARALARECLAGLGVASGASPPPFAAAGGWRERRRLQGHVRRLWELAHGLYPVAVSAGELKRLRAAAEEVRAAAAAGRLWFGPAASGRV